MTALPWETARTRLRALTADDLELLLQLDADPGVLRYITGGAPLPRAEMIDWVLPRFLGPAAQGHGLGFYVAHDRATDSFLGWAHLRRDEAEPAWVEVGYRLRTAWWGNGLATEITQALIHIAFAVRGELTVSARALVGNAASRRVMEKCGLRDAGTYLLPPDRRGSLDLPARDAFVYTLARADWRP
jgi:RimJ/RimL family protein N-acetyltransferase